MFVNYTKRQQTRFLARLGVGDPEDTQNKKVYAYT